MNTPSKPPVPDAAATLGTIIGDHERRDAIHLAVTPAVAAYTLEPGDHVGFLEDGTASLSAKPVGIVDPFLSAHVKRGQRFWLVVYPRQITSLRHVWTHPAFADEGQQIEVPPVSSSSDPVSASRKWIEDFAADIDQTYNRLMDAAATWVEDKDCTYDNSEAYKPHWDKFSEFWKHYEVVRGVKLPEMYRECFFTCSC